MPRLSIVIPCVQNAACFEATLASVLQNRPTDCEILVVQPRPYDDPYDLGGEVRFLEAPADSSVIDLINAGVRAAEGSIVHLLSTDVEVLEGWTEAALPHFDDPQIGSVAPLVVQRAAFDIVVRGVQYGAGGRRKPRATSLLRWRARRRILGPTLLAGFYRRQALLDVGGFCSSVGAHLADIDMALALHALALTASHEEDSIVQLQQSATDQPVSLRGGREAERLFWRNAATSGWLVSLLLHPWTVAGELICNAHRPVVLMQLMGRTLALLEFATFRRHWRRLESLRARYARETNALMRQAVGDPDRDRRMNSRAAA